MTFGQAESSEQSEALFLWQKDAGGKGWQGWIGESGPAFLEDASEARNYWRQVSERRL